MFSPNGWLSSSFFFAARALLFDELLVGGGVQDPWLLGAVSFHPNSLLSSETQGFLFCFLAAPPLRPPTLLLVHFKGESCL